MIPQIIIDTGAPVGWNVPITAPMPTPTDPPTCPAIDWIKMRPVFFKNFFPESYPVKYSITWQPMVIVANAAVIDKPILFVRDL